MSPLDERRLAEPYRHPSARRNGRLVHSSFNAERAVRNTAKFEDRYENAVSVVIRRFDICMHV
jgi:hypothetical protein